MLRSRWKVTGAAQNNKITSADWRHEFQQVGGSWYSPTREQQVLPCAILLRTSHHDNLPTFQDMSLTSEHHHIFQKASVNLASGTYSCQCSWPTLSEAWFKPPRDLPKFLYSSLPFEVAKRATNPTPLRKLIPSRTCRWHYRLLWTIRNNAERRYLLCRLVDSVVFCFLIRACHTCRAALQRRLGKVH